MNNNQLGKKGEELAVQLLRKKGHRILKQNWRWHHFEIDIISKLDDILVITEVKTRSNDDFELPEAAVNKSKKKAIADATEAYLELNSIDNEVRFDIISVYWNGSNSTLYHIEDAFWPGVY